MTQLQFSVTESQVKLTEAKNVSEPQGLIEAVFTTFGRREGQDGRKFNYQPEGFMEFVEDFKEAGRPLPMFVQHDDSGMPVGEWTDIEMDGEKMHGKGRLYLNTTQGSNLYTIMMESPKMFGGVSVGAYADEYQMVNEAGEVSKDGEYFQITKGGLREVSMVIHPNNSKAEVTKLEQCLRDDNTVDLKQIEAHLREAGLSRANATAAASVLKQVIELRDASIAAKQTTEDARDESAAVNEEVELSELLEELELRSLLSALKS